MNGQTCFSILTVLDYLHIISKLHLILFQNQFQKQLPARLFYLHISLTISCSKEIVAVFLQLGKTKFSIK